MKNAYDSQCGRTTNIGARKKINRRVNMRFDLEKTYKYKDYVQRSSEQKKEIISIYSQSIY